MHTHLTAQEGLVSLQEDFDYALFDLCLIAQQIIHTFGVIDLSLLRL
jgi:hypothetical protein